MKLGLVGGMVGGDVALLPPSGTCTFSRKLLKAALTLESELG